MNRDMHYIELHRVIFHLMTIVTVDSCLARLIPIVHCTILYYTMLYYSHLITHLTTFTPTTNMKEIASTSTSTSLNNDPYSRFKLRVNGLAALQEERNAPDKSKFRIYQRCIITVPFPIYTV